MNVRKIAKEKEKKLRRFDYQVGVAVIKSQNALRRKILAEVLPYFDRDGDRIKNTGVNLRAVAQIRKVFNDWSEKEGESLAKTVTQAIVGAHKESLKYFGKVLKGTHTKKAIERAGDEALSALRMQYGIKKVGEKMELRNNSYIIMTIKDDEVIQRLENLVRGSIISEQPFSKLRDNIGIALGRGGNVGELEKKISERLPQPALMADRTINTRISASLELNYAIYQGGEMRTTRAFCEERNNKVFSREEIARFGTSADQYGGYSNKSQGEFQGKPKVYNPFTDVGGYNCRHTYDWISDELAVILRPDLKNEIENK